MKCKVNEGNSERVWRATGLLDRIANDPDCPFGGCLGRKLSVHNGPHWLSAKFMYQYLRPKAVAFF